MSFNTTKIPRLALGILTICCVLLISSGCTSFQKTVTGWWPWGEEPDSLTVAEESPFSEVPETLPGGGDDAAVQPPLDDRASVEAPAAAPDAVLTYWEAIDGGLVSGTSGVLRATVDAVTGQSHLSFQRPTAICVRFDYVYVVDMGLDYVLRYERSTGLVERVIEISGLTQGDVQDIYVTNDLRVYITDTEGSRVLLFDERGRFIRSFENLLNLSKPVAVFEDEPTGSVYIADGVFDHVLLFNQQGEIQAAYGGRGDEPGQFLNITAMAPGPDGFYVGARVGQRVQVLSQQGEYLYSLDQTKLRFPMALAVTPDFHVFIADYLDNSIKVYNRGRFLTSIGGTGVGPGQFKRITDLWLDDGFLYVADSLNARIQVMRVTPESVPEPPAEQEG